MLIYVNFRFLVGCFSIYLLASICTKWEYYLCICNAPNTPAGGRYSWRDLDWPHRSILVFSAHFVLTHAHPRATSRSVTHPDTTPSWASLTLEFCPNRLPEKKEFLIDMSSLSSLISQAITYTPTQRNRRPRRATGTFPLGTYVCASSLVHVPCRVPRRVTNVITTWPRTCPQTSM